MENVEKIKALMEKVAELSSKEEGFSAKGTGELLDAYEELVQMLSLECDEREEKLRAAKFNHAKLCISIRNIATTAAIGTNNSLTWVQSLNLISDLAHNELKGDDRKCDIIATSSRGYAIE